MVRKILSSILVHTIVIFLYTGCKRYTPTTQTPELIVVIVIDQLNYSHLEKIVPSLDGGLRLLFDKGLVFSNFFHDHAITNTAPGHASISTGFYPAQHGIIDNYFYDYKRGKTVTSTTSYSGYDTASNLLKPTIGDLLKSRCKKCKVVSISPKTRAAIMLGGRKADLVAWYSRKKGYFTTNKSYRYRKLLKEVKAEKFFTSIWHISHFKNDLRTIDSHYHPETGNDHTNSRFISLYPGREFYSQLYNTALLDRLTLEAIEKVFKNHNLGQDSYPDILLVSLSSLDTVGHKYGPFTPEWLATVEELDSIIARIIETVQKNVKSFLFLLTSDHGVAELPYNKNGFRRIAPNTIVCLRKAATQYSDLFVSELNVSKEASLEDIRSLKNDLEKCEDVEKVWTVLDLNDNSEFGTLFRNSYYKLRSPSFVIQFEKGTVPVIEIATTHGSFYEYDRHVPLVVWTTGKTAQKVTARYASVDIAPTIAAILGLKNSKFAGKPISEVIEWLH